MSRKTLLVLLAFGALAPVPVLADTIINGQPVTNNSKNLSISKSNEDMLSEMSDSEFPGGATAKSVDADGDGVADNNFGAAYDVSGITDPNAAENAKDAAKEKEAKVKYVYKGQSDYMMRRSIKDDRIEDGYVQGLLRQYGPK